MPKRLSDILADIADQEFPSHQAMAEAATRARQKYIRDTMTDSQRKVALCFMAEGVTFEHALEVAEAI
jgi:hypothetical protein